MSLLKGSRCCCSFQSYFREIKEPFLSFACFPILISATAIIADNAGLIFQIIHSFFSEERRTRGCNCPNRCALTDLLPTLPVWDSVGVFGPDAVHSDKFSQVLRTFILHSDRQSRLLIKDLKAVLTSTVCFLNEVKYQ